jgi:hypothetical protein
MPADRDLVGETRYQQGIDALRVTKLAQTIEKQEVPGAMDSDDTGLALSPPDLRELIHIVGASGLAIDDCHLSTFGPVTNHPSGGLFRPKIVGANPDPGFRRDGSPTALALATASVQPGYGNTAPVQIELDPSFASDGNAVDTISALIRSHFDLGGTQINMSLVDTAKLLEASQDPIKHPDLIVRVTGSSAYFASLSSELRQLVVDRILPDE